VEGDKRIALDREFMPDPQAKAINIPPRQGQAVGGAARPVSPRRGMSGTMYEERFYRGLSKPQDLVCYEVKIKETDLFCCTSTDVRSVVEERAHLYRHQLEAYIAQRPDFLHSLVPVEPDPLAPRIVKEMLAASEAVGVGPMACVAGAVAEFIGHDVEVLCDEFIIENGGDIQLRTKKER